MSKVEKQEIQELPEKYRPLGAWAYFGYNILFSIPVVGLVFLIIFACKDSNINRRSYARSFFCALLVAVIALVIAFVIVLALGGMSAVTDTVSKVFQQ